jgi:hypothetical protein
MDYQGLLAIAKQNPDAADYTKLRMLHTQSPGYGPFRFDSKSHHTLSNAMDIGDISAALDALHQLLSVCYLDIHAHMLAIDIYEKLGDSDLETYHMKFAMGLLDSIIRSGDGTSFETAFVVISAQEEYALLRVLSLEPIMQSFREHEGHKYDVFESPHPKTGKIIEVFFNIDLPMDWLDHKISHIDLPARRDLRWKDQRDEEEM